MKVMLPKQTNLSEVSFIQSKIKLTISLLVSNRIDSIRKCMESLKIILDAVPSELIAVDTVGEENSDGSLDVVKEYTDKIVHFDWINDFAAARNAGLKLAKGEWFLYVDDDEWFDDPTEIIEFFQSGEYEEYGCSQYAIRSYTDEAMTEYSESWGSRLIRLTTASRFIHPVHEIITPVSAPEKKFTRCFAHHSGYIFKNAEDRKKHFERNIGPILEELERHPNNLRLLMQAIQEYQFDGNFEKAEELCRQGEKNKNSNYDLIWNWIVAELVETLALQGKNQEAMDEGERLLKLPRVNQLAQMKIDYCLSSVAQILKDTERVLKYAEDYKKLERYFDENPDRVLEHIMLTLGDVLQESKRENIHKTLFMTYKNEEKYEELCDYSDRIAWDKDYMKQKLFYFFLIEAVTNIDHYESLTLATQKICDQGEFPNDWMEEVRQICQGIQKQKRYLLCKAFTEVESEEEYFLILKAWCAEQDGGDVSLALQACLDREMDCAVPREDLLGICLRTGNDPTPFLEALYFEDWVLSFTQVVKNTDKEDLEELLQCGKSTLASISPQKYNFLAKVVWQRYLDDPDLEEDQLWEIAENYNNYTLQYHKSIYRADIFEEKDCLPRDVVFSLQLQYALEAKKQGDLDGTFTALKECVKAFPPRKDFVTRLIKQIEQEMEQSQEFTELGEQIKKQLYQLISIGKTMEAQKILETLRTLIPNDRELDTIAQKISV